MPGKGFEFLDVLEQLEIPAAVGELFDGEEMQQGLGRELHPGEKIFIAAFMWDLEQLGNLPDSEWLLAELMATEDRMREWSGLDPKSADFAGVIADEARERAWHRRQKPKTVEGLRKLYRASRSLSDLGDY